MRYSQPCSLLASVVAGLGLLLLPQAASAQASKTVRFKTADGVELVGTFFTGGKGDACVLLLHDIGKGRHRNQGGWDSLAKTLQKQGYTVLSFDFRGHGESTTIEDPQTFWANRANARLVKGNKAAPGEIHVKQFDAAYYPILINDIAAAKSFLDRQNDSGTCNTSALFVIGAGKAATLGSIWLNSEWQRYKVLDRDPLGRVLKVAPEPEGNGTIGAVWLSISPSLGKRTVSPASVLSLPARMRGVPVLFLYGEGDKKGDKEAKVVVKHLSMSPGKRDKHTGLYMIPKASGAKGEALLKGSLGTEKAIAAWVADVLEKKTPEQVNREFVKSAYIWGTPAANGIIPTGRAVIAKSPGSQIIQWNSYESFIPR
jgi:hypothetical protein